MPEALSCASAYSVALLTGFVRAGVRQVVLSPGSRSQALALVCAELERIGAISLHVRIDERVAGFLALGLAVETGLPAVVVTTSGTATANLHPAVLEAHHSRVPMIVLTADRPAELRGVRANQTTDQPGLYGSAIRFQADVPAPTGEPGEADAAGQLARRAVTAALGPVAGPVHLNLAFREPLSSPVPDLAALVTDRPGPEGPGSRGEEPAPVEVSADRTVVVAGHGAGAEAEEFAHQGGWPLVAEVSSGAHFGRNLIVAYRELLANRDFGGQAECVVVFGHPTLSREVPALLRSEGVRTIVVNPPDCEAYDPAHSAHVAASVVATGSPADRRDWLGAWVVASRALLEAADTDQAPDVAASRSGRPAEYLKFVRTELDVSRQKVTRQMLVRALWRTTWPLDRLVLGASRLIRDADRSVPGKKISVHANRGLGGIDGTVSTAIGIALASQDEEAGAGGVTRVLLGDLALLHDAGALLFGQGEVRPRLQVVVGNDGGGTIFDGLEVAQTAPSAALDRVLYTPHSVDLAALAAAYGWEYTRAATRSELDAVLLSRVTGPGIIEVPLTR